MLNRNDVQFNKKLNINQIIESLLQSENKISVFNDDIVKFLIIYTYLNTFFRFTDINHWKADEKCAEVYEFFLKVLIQSFFKHFELISDYEI